MQGEPTVPVDENNTLGTTEQQDKKSGPPTTGQRIAITPAWAFHKRVIPSVLFKPLVIIIIIFLVIYMSYST